MFDDELPRLILVSGRSDAGVRQTIKMVSAGLTFTAHLIWQGKK